ncbi:MAG: DNA replication/repair protein RecF [Mucilaginibacter polytrichastri]|nr:DNA replication/repair protein RecF [Mucilaginibacter polytrichastri]
MFLRTLSLISFKNYAEAELSFSPALNALTGDNGAGKTNVLDAIHYLGLCKSYFNPIDSQQILQGADFFMLNGVFEKNGRDETVSCAVKRNQKKQFRRNKKDYPRLADHIGLFPLVMVSPVDALLITEGSEERRRFIDNVISQTDNQYLDELIAYNRILLNRNAVLKNMAETGSADAALVEIFDEQLAASGMRIFERRKEFLDVFVPLFDQHYRFLTGEAEPVSLVYQSPLFDGDFLTLLQHTFARDRILQRTSVGIHKDELEFTVHDMPLKKFGSQGQQKSFLIALKLAQYSYLQKAKGFKPLLLLDDIFDKLDDRRIGKLMEMVSHDDFGQVFITDTNRDRIQSVFDRIGKEIRIFDVVKGSIAHA